MNTASTPPLAGSAPGAASGNIVKRAGLIVALAALVAIDLMPAAQGLPQAGQLMLGILAFAVIVWMTEALDYSVSAVVIGALMIFLLAYAPDATKPSGADMGTGAALNLALSGFFFQQCGRAGSGGLLHRRGDDRHWARPAHRAGGAIQGRARTNHIVIGAMVVGFLLSR